MNKDNKGKVIKLNISRDINDKKPSIISNDKVIDIRKNQMDKMIDDLASINKREDEDLLEM